MEDKPTELTVNEGNLKINSKRLKNQATQRLRTPKRLIEQARKVEELISESSVSWSET